MVDLNWIAAKLIERENAEKDRARAYWLELVQTLMEQDYTTRFAVDGFNVEVTVTLKKPEDYPKYLQMMRDAGFAKPVYGSKPQTDVKEGLGVVESITTSARMYNNKPMYDHNLAMDDGTVIVVTKFTNKEFRKGDKVEAFKNAKGYQDMRLAGSRDENDDIPF